MENYDKQITSEVTKNPKNKKKIVLISVIAATVVLLILLSSLIPALILNAKIESLENDISSLKYFEFEPNEDETAYKITANKILPKQIVIPNEYNGLPVESVELKSTTVESISLGKNIKSFSLYLQNLKECTIHKDNLNLKVIDDVIYDSTLQLLLFVLPQKQNDFTLPSSFTYDRIHENAFISSNIPNLYIPSECNFQELIAINCASINHSNKMNFQYSTTKLKFCFGISEIKYFGSDKIISSELINDAIIHKFHFQNEFQFDCLLPVEG